jgi:hypothetical protein
MRLGGFTNNFGTRPDGTSFSYDVQAPAEPDLFSTLTGGPRQNIFGMSMPPVNGSLREDSYDRSRGASGAGTNPATASSTSFLQLLGAIGSIGRDAKGQANWQNRSGNPTRYTLGKQKRFMDILENDYLGLEDNVSTTHPRAARAVLTQESRWAYAKIRSILYNVR